MGFTEQYFRYRYRVPHVFLYRVLRLAVSVPFCYKIIEVYQLRYQYESGFLCSFTSLTVVKSLKVISYVDRSYILWVLNLPDVSYTSAWTWAWCTRWLSWLCCMRRTPVCTTCPGCWLGCSYTPAPAAGKPGPQQVNQRGYSTNALPFGGVMSGSVSCFRWVDPDRE